MAEAPIYNPQPAPASLPEDQRQFLDEELARIQDVSNGISGSLGVLKEVVFIGGGW